jgi:hypothetical protein
MFRTKYTVTILDSKWQVIKNNLKLSVVPRQGEYIYLDNKYVNVINVVHSVDHKHVIFVVVEEISVQPQNNLSSDNQQVS